MISRDIIAAQATPTGQGGVSIIRVSGHQCRELLDPLCLPKISHLPPQHVQFGQVHDQDGQLLDECLFVPFQRPRSFTGEDLVEIQCHGSPYIVQKILALLYARGARPAEPGEFTRRAYENGKMSLMEAEAIAAMVAAESTDQWQAAQEMNGGILTVQLNALREKILAVLAQMESQIEFPDEGDVEVLHQDSIVGEIDSIRSTLTELINTYQSGRTALHGLHVALIGPPNAGKSTLLNHLTRSQRAIVTPIAGTTRDFIEVSTLINGHLFRFVDTAGLHESDDQIEKEGMTRSHEIALKADLVLLLLPANTSVKEKSAFCSAIPTKILDKSWLITTKKDLSQDPVSHEFLDHLNLNSFTLSISSLEKQSLSALEDALIRHIRQSIDSTPAALGRISLARHHHCISLALEAVARCQAEAVASVDRIDFVASELYQAARHLDELVGNVANEEVLGEIFSNFCVGK